MGTASVAAVAVLETVSISGIIFSEWWCDLLGVDFELVGVVGAVDAVVELRVDVKRRRLEYVVVCRRLIHGFHFSAAFFLNYLICDDDCQAQCLGMILKVIFGFVLVRIADYSLDLVAIVYIVFE